VSDRDEDRWAELGDWPDSEPRTDTGPVDVELLLRLLRRVEADGNRRGWDSTPLTLFAVYEHADEHTHAIYRKFCGSDPRVPASARVGGYTAQPLFPPQILYATGIPVYEALRNYAVNIAYCPKGDTPEYRGVNMCRHLLRLPGVVAVGVTYEAWQREAMSREDLERELVVDAPDFSTMPGSVEMRNAMAVDLEGRTHEVKRTRGDRPVTVGGYRMLVPGHGEQVGERADTNTRGDLSNSLRILVDMITGSSPGPEGFDERYTSYRASLRSRLEQRDAGSTPGG
jgi:hypothetical protein